MPTIHPYHPDAVALLMAEQLTHAYHQRGFASLAIPGGRTPAQVLTTLAGRLGEPVRGALHLFWVDERAVPVGDLRRNDGHTLRSWQEGGPLPGHVHPMPAETTDLAEAAQTYAELLNRCCQGQPLDVVLLGVGEDGHIASLYPDHPALDAIGEVLVIEDSPREPRRRLTLSLRVLCNARFRAVLARGAEKAQPLYEAIRGGERRVPTSLLPAIGTHWFADDAAARLLPTGIFRRREQPGEGSASLRRTP